MLDDCLVWLKKAPSHNPQWRYALQGWAAAVLRIPGLRPVPNSGGASALRMEVRRIAQLCALGVRVPVVLAQQEQALLLSDAAGACDVPSVSLAIRMERLLPHDAQQALLWWQRGLDAISDVHFRGGYLSQAFARNMVCGAGGAIGFVDFEDDPHRTLSLHECQARDWLSYLHSTAYLLLDRVEKEALQRPLRAALSAPPEKEALHALHLMSRRGAWLRHLPSHQRWGRDTQRLRCAAFLLWATLA